MAENTNPNEQQWKLLVLLLKEIADSKKITQEEIAERSGLLQSNISRFFALKYCPNMSTFLLVSKALKVNFFFEDQEGTTELNLLFEKAMDALGRRVDKLPKN